MARPRTRIGFNIAELESALSRQRSELKKLNKERADLERKLDAVERRIAEVGGNGTGRRGRGGRARNEQPLPDVIEQVLRGAGKPMGVGDIAEAALGTGYRSNSGNFKSIVNQALIKDKRFGQTERGIYQLAKKS
jgi:DNA-binding transcriptional MerR regulator